MNHLRYFGQNSSRLRNHVLMRRQTSLIPSTSRAPFKHLNKQFSNQPDRRSTYSLHPQKTSKCPKCGRLLPTRLPACSNPGCGYIETLPHDLRRDYFGLFGLSGVVGRSDSASIPGPSDAVSSKITEGINGRNAFSVDPKLLRQRFLQMQKVCHPDVWAKRGPEAAAVADAQSAQINRAYQTLLSPRLRGEYILSQQGIDIGEADTMEEEQQLAMEVMEAREELENAEGEEVRNLMKINDERIEAATADLENSIGTENWEEAKRAVIRLRYWESFERAGKGQEVDH